MSETFDPKEWLDKEPAKPTPSKPVNSNLDSSSEVDKVITRIEANFTDITTSYTDWLNVGFALANEFGEAGRSFYHRVSRFYNGYTKIDTDKQYDHCLKSQGHGITIKTFFHMAKEAGIDCTRERWNDGTRERGDEGVKGRSKSNPSTEPSFSPSTDPSKGNGENFVPSSPLPIVPSEEDDPPEEEQPTLPDFIFDQIPDFFKKAVQIAETKEERDILLLGAIVTLSSSLSQIYGIYDGYKVYPNLYLYVTAQASAGKGRLKLCKNLVNLIHWEKRKESQQAYQQYEIEMREYNAAKNKDMGLEKPEKPPVKMLFIPANNSTTGFFQILSDNDGKGLIFETEGDTISQSFKTDYGNFSDGFRKAFHHESISYYRRTDREYVEIDRPCVSTVITSTFAQILSLIPSVENGLASRFMFYFMNIKPVWKNVFAYSNDIGLEAHFNQLGKDFYSLYSSLIDKDPMVFKLTEEQQQEFNTCFAQMQDKYLVLQGLDYMAIIRRLGLIAFRVMMVLTAMRIPETGDYSVKQECAKEDFETALAIIRIMVRHASYIVSQLPAEVKIEKRENKKESFFDRLPEKFCRKEFLELATSLGFGNRTADKYIAAFCEKGLLERPQLNVYMKKPDQ
ncbi:MAG: DUF3987 domain-containing protein [Bacteroidales bacterium]